MQTAFLKRCFGLLWVILYNMVMWGQNKQTDSLLSLLKTTSNDTTRVNLLNSLGKQFALSSNFAEAKKYGEQALALAEKKHFINGITKSYNTLGNIYHGEGVMYHGKGNYAEALTRYFTGLKYREKAQNKEAMAKSYGNIGLIHWQRYNFSEALKYFLISLKLFQEIGHKIGIASTYNNIGLIYVNQKNYQEGMKYYKATLDLYQQLGETGRMIDLYFNMGFLNEEQGSYEEAVKDHQFALKICEEMNDKDGIAASYTNIGGAIYLFAKHQPDGAEKQQELKTSLDYQNKALKLYQELNSSSSYTNVDIQIAKAYMEMKDLSSAKKYLQDAVTYSGEANIYDTKETYELLTTVDSALGDWQSSLKNHKLYIFYKDSLVNEENTRKIMQAQLQYQFDKKEDSLEYQQQLIDNKLQEQILLSRQQKQSILFKEQELSLLNTEKQLQQLHLEKNETDMAFQKSEAVKRQNQLVLLNKEKELQTLQLKKQKQLKNYLIAGVGFLFLFSFFIYRNYRVRQQLKLQTLRNKIASDLHDDVGSTLSSISIFSQMAQQQSKEVIPMLETIGESSRKMLDAMADIVWTINPENDQFEKIISRMKNFAYELLGAKNIDFEFVADDDVANFNVPMEVRKNLYLIFKEATNNMVKYAGANKAMFAIKGEKNSLTMMIKDNGKGFDLNKSTEGNGLRNMKKRANEIGAQLVIDSYPGNGTTIQLSVAV